ncbi:TlpA family protein disulfide reductase [Flavobacterium selenitireducens]|uniref:TlpA family protein disulfide reductase n=1 Tax=Flavobacterium selenitireducens TaxID=2722704 RepID=UPI001CC2F4BD|nr:thioredoxin-like domain-containing protein [Flavobacterium selenitireducens]
MPDLKVFRTLAVLCAPMLMMMSCDKKYGRKDYTAYFGGEVQNPVTRYVLFCKDGQVMDTIPLKSDNTFFKTFDSLAPGLYSFRHDPEYQYVYFDKNDSLMVRVNARDFDESIVFCGRGDQKNNFLMEMYLRNESDKNQFYPIFDLDVKGFEKATDSSYLASQAFYEKKKSEIQWNEDFDKFAKAALDFHHFAKKEIYPTVHRVRTGQDLTDEIPESYYAFRKDVDFNDKELSAYAPYLNYLSHMLGNMAAINYHNHFTEADLALKTNINKIQIADTLIKDEKVKNVILNNIAFTYLLEDQNIENNHKFLEIFHKYSTDDDKKNEISKIGQAIQRLKTGSTLPEVDLVGLDGKTIASGSFTGKKTVFFCWTEKLESHFTAAHKKVMDFKMRHPEYQFVAVNVDDDPEKWAEILSQYRFPGVLETRCSDFEDVKDKWAITKIHRTIIVNADGTIRNAFANLFDVNFEKELEDGSFEHAVTINN